MPFDDHAPVPMAGSALVVLGQADDLKAGEDLAYSRRVAIEVGVVFVAAGDGSGPDEGETA